MIYYGLTITHILTLIAASLFVLFLILYLISMHMERNRPATEVQIILDSLNRCYYGGQCKKCEYRNRKTDQQTCRETLLYDANKVIKEQHKLIAKFAKMMK